LPDQFVGDAPVRLSLTSAQAFPVLEYGPKKERVAKLFVRGPDPNAAFTVENEGKKALRLIISAGQGGIYVVALELSPRYIELTPAKVNAYFSEIDAPAAIRAAYQELPGPRRWREIYTKHAKAVICVQVCQTTEVLERPSGLGFEFVLAEERAGGEFRLLLNGRAVTNAAVNMHDRSGKHIRLRTNGEGAIVLPVGTSGPTLLSAVLVETPRTKGGRFTSDFAALTFDASLMAPR
jgi:hypothetical protein